ncbi:hypothetical protein SBA3_1930003 [Candidatus Sulfopaludibacter sp. SbA3]|nr:hypothetical protein SBA3_1930003 [Candidatus Sulfopaludibacter sp. SbA3]
MVPGSAGYQCRSAYGAALRLILVLRYLERGLVFVKPVGPGVESIHAGLGEADAFGKPVQTAVDVGESGIHLGAER